MKNENVKINDNEVMENFENVLKKPYTNETMIKKVKLYLKPLLKNKRLAEKWSLSIWDLAEMNKMLISDDIECVEDNILRKVKEKSYGNALKKIKNNSMLLIGKIILSGSKEVSHIEKYIIRIRSYLNYMYALDCSVASCLYDCADKYNSNSYITLSNTVTRAYANFNIDIYQNYRNMVFEKIELQDLEENAKNTIQILSTIYDSLMNLATQVLNLEDGDRLYEYKIQLEDFIRNMVRVISYMTGQIYMQVDTYNYIHLNAKKHINKIICKLEENVLPIHLFTLKYNFENGDKDQKSHDSLVCAYQDVKRNISNLNHILLDN